MHATVKFNALAIEWSRIEPRAGWPLTVPSVSEAMIHAGGVTPLRTPVDLITKCTTEWSSGFQVKLCFQKYKY